MIDPAPIVFEQILAITKNQQKPSPAVNKNGGSPMHDVPAHVIEVPPGGGGFDGEREIPTAAGSTIRTQHFARLEVCATHFDFGHDSSPR
jgi:hypothetical protein